MKHINELTIFDYEQCIDSASNALNSIPEIIEFIEKVEEIAKLFYNGSFVSTNFITYLSYYLRRNTIDNTTQQLETFGAQVLSNINLKLNE